MDTVRERPFGGVIAQGPDGSTDTNLSISFRTKNYGAITPETEPASWPSYIVDWPDLRRDVAIRDKFHHIVPAFSSDEAGIGLWWYWMVKRGGFGPNGSVSFEQIAKKYAGTDDATSPAVTAYVVDYTGLSSGAFGRAVDKNESLHLGDLETRWNLARTMFQHESGKPVPFDRPIFEKGIALATAVINGGTAIPNAGTPVCPAVPSCPAVTTCPVGPAVPKGPECPATPTGGVTTPGTLPLSKGIMELSVGKATLRFDGSVDVAALSRILDMLLARP
jgi:hypothetical protein